MLKNFIYLNEPALDSYLSALEDGLRGSVEERRAKSGSVTGKGGVPVVNVQGEKAHEEEETTSRTDTPAARFERLQKLARSDVEASGWVEVVNPEVDLNGLLTGALIELECEIYVPEIVKALSPGGGLASAIGQMEALAKLAPAFGSDVSGMPAQSQLDAMKGIAGALGGDVMFVGEPSDGDFHITGKLLDAYINSEIEGYARVVGKVSSQWSKASWKPLLALPGMNLMSRDKRREMERKGPSEGQEQNWLEGPAIMLDVLAIYR
ncbi:hypothetical protein [Pseudolysinimonas sp.]|jgi:hypothetical protein|uniref:DUF6414 family protein n=1 Tax=Pseudolysinimonas sp. TaxID=2680009 RepID=UPI0037852400